MGSTLRGDCDRYTGTRVSTYGEPIKTLRASARRGCQDGGHGGVDATTLPDPALCEVVLAAPRHRVRTEFANAVRTSMYENDISPPGDRRERGVASTNVSERSGPRSSPG